jgi:hypothetical protein
LFQQGPVLFRETLKSYTDSPTRIPIDNLGVYYNLFLAYRDTQQQNCAFADFRLGVQVEAARAYILGAGDTGRILAVEEDVHNQARTIMLSPFIVQPLVLGKLITHGGAPPNLADSLCAHCTRFHDFGAPPATA